jgi:hypothetical protein
VNQSPEDFGTEYVAARLDQLLASPKPKSAGIIRGSASGAVNVLAKKIAI